MYYYVYILECADGSLYTGITNDLEKRLAMHKAGTASKYTRAKKASSMLYTERKRNRSYASKREAAIKKLTRQQKLDLIHSNQSKR